MTRLTVVIPTRETSLPDDNATIATLRAQTFRDFKIIVQHDWKRGANWARNAGFQFVDTELVLFCDDDIIWNPKALEKMILRLDKTDLASYVYCGYEMGGKYYCMRTFDADILRSVNYISTMSIIRTADFVGFDEKILRFQDWDLWLSTLANGKVGVWCGECLFSTPIRIGITHNNEFTPHEAAFAIKRKHHLS